MQRTARIKAKASGHTYLELVVVVLVIGIATKTALPRYALAMQRYQLEAAAKHVAADLEFAREYAKSRGTAQQVVFNLASSSYSAVGMNDPTRVGQTYQVNLSASGYPATIAQLNFGASGSDATITFDMYGRPDYAGSLTIRVGSLQKVISVDAWGKLTTS